MGCEVVVFSTTESKREQAIQLGASRFVVTRKQFMPIMAKGGSILPLALLEPEAKLDIPYLDFLMKGLQIISSLPNLISYNSMLGFAARHDISPIIDRDEMSIDGIMKSLKKLKAGKTRYRGVLYATTEA
jgi:D-arabinose 1-dehydrogenase-like Zn-dependent alcohol dehydrogenase